MNLKNISKTILYKTIAVLIIIDFILLLRVIRAFY